MNLIQIIALLIAFIALGALLYAVFDVNLKNNQ